MDEAYTGFAGVYDEFMDNVPYEEWAEFIIGRLLENGIEDGLVLDLGCGTGTLTRLLAQRGFDMIGVDGSLDMLEIARQCSAKGAAAQKPASEGEPLAAAQGPGKGSEILYLCQDMREFELYGTVKAVVSVCDSLNYITEPSELKTVFRLVNNYLERGGLFIFDLNTPFKFREMLGDSTFAEDRDNKAFIWDNCFDEESGINEYALTLFTEDEDGRYTKSTELHYERCYDIDEIKSLLAEAGMEFVGAFADYTDEPYKVDSEAERMVIVAREGFQEGKKYE